MSNYLVTILVLTAAITGAYLYYDYSQEKIAYLTELNAELKVAAQTCEETNNNLVEDIERTQSLVLQLQNRAQEAEKYQDELIEKLHKHNLTALTLKKPGLIEKRVNDATKEIFEEIESTTSGN